MRLTKKLRLKAKKTLNKAGYDVHRIHPIIKDGCSVIQVGSAEYQAYRYLASDGTFDYERYREVQTAGNKRKIQKVSVIEDNIKFLSAYIKQKKSPLRFGLCHGTRRGLEQKWFRTYLNCEVLGTEISDTATEFPDTIQWDFHETKPEWIEAVDFIYSNSLDHSYDPGTCLKAWMSCLSPDGICILEHTDGSERAKELDPFGAPIAIMPYLVLLWSQGTFSVQEILIAPALSESRTYISYLILKNNR